MAEGAPEMNGVHEKEKGLVMWLRTLLGGLVGGIAVFFAGFLGHGIMHLQSRTFGNIPDDSGFIEHLKTHKLTHGLYFYPDMPTGAAQNDSAKMAEASERFKTGPTGFLLIAHDGEARMGEMLGKEFASNLIAAMIAAWIVSLLAADVGFLRRWLAVFLMGVFAWFSLSASYGIWYRFPHDFLHDELLCAALEWGAAGLAIAVIVRRPKPAVVQASTT
jgi:hypothetical protein